MDKKNITQEIKIHERSSGSGLTQQVIINPPGGSIPPAVQPVAPPTPFVNREKERHYLAQALIARRGDVHTIVGMPGVGKTALAARVVHDVVDRFPGGVLWLSLEACPSLDTLWRQIISAYTTYSPSSDVAGTARAFLNDRRPLLVVDSADCAPSVARVLLDERGAATVLLVTRDRNIAAGYGGLPLEIKPLPRSDAMTLFGARTGTIEKPPLVDRLCELLGDLPLAINLAAGYVNSYGERLQIYLELLGDLSLDEVLDLGDWRGMSISKAFDLTYTRLNDEACLGSVQK